MKTTYSFIIILLSLAFSAQAQSTALKAPIELKAQWEPSNTQIKLTWSNQGRSSGQIAFVVQRKFYASTATAINGVWQNVGYKAAAEPDLPGTQSFSFIDTLPTTTSQSAINSYFYRVRPVTGAIAATAVKTLTIWTYGEAAETITEGTYNTTTNRDTDADGLLDSVEQSYNANALDWADGFADHDGDNIPNAWEAASIAGPVAIIDAAFTGTEGTGSPLMFRSFKTALTNASVVSGSSLANSPYKLIHVRPGLYIENGTAPATIISPHTNCQFALVRKPAGTADQYKQVEIRAGTTGPLFTATNSLVLDGMVLTRSPGTSGPIIEASNAALDTDYVSARVMQVRLVNCLIANADSGNEALIENRRTRVVISHCSFWMNACSTSAPAHTCGAGGIYISTGTAAAVGSSATSVPIVATTPLVPAAHFLQTTARYVIHNSILWNPINTMVPEVYWTALVPEITGPVTPASNLIYGLVSEGMSLDPYLTPEGNLRGPSSFAIPPYEVGAAPYSSNVVGKADSTGSLRVLTDMYGQLRGNPAGRSLLPPVLLTAHDIGAQQWRDDDSDGLPDCFDSNVGNRSNAELDLDFDSLNELQEYLAGTNSQSADSAFLTLGQAQNLFASINSSFNGSSYYTKTQVDQFIVPLATRTWTEATFVTKTAADQRYWRVGDTLRMAPAGDLGMGAFTSGPTPPPAP